MEDVLRETEIASVEGRASLDVYVTGDASHHVSNVEDAIDEKTPEDIKRQLVASRPDLRMIVGKACATTVGRLAIVGQYIWMYGRSVPSDIAPAACGPESFVYDIRNEVAARQLANARGEGAAEIFLHTESYS
jgi:hypothetical protein